MTLSPRERIIGSLVGLVVGDALGVPVEFCDRPARDRDPVSGMRGYGTHHQPAGTWSDDGAMTLASAAAFVAHGWDLTAQAQGFLAWLDSGAWSAYGKVFDIGNTTYRALDRFSTSKTIDGIGGADVLDNGNGSLMRILPAACWCHGAGTTTVISQVGAASALTHAHARSQLACAFHALVVESLIDGHGIAAAVSAAGRRIRRHIPVEDSEHFAKLLDGICLTQGRDEVRSDGYVISTMEAACWCLRLHQDFAGSVLTAVNLGSDTDTTGAVTGGLAGLRCGVAGIPEEWISVLPRHAEVIALAERFADACLARWHHRATDSIPATTKT